MKRLIRRPLASRSYGSSVALMLSPRFLMRVVRSEIEKGARFIESARKLYEEADAQVVDHLDFPYSGSIAVVPYLHLERLGEADEIAMHRPDPGTP